MSCELVLNGIKQSIADKTTHLFILISIWYVHIKTEMEDVN